MSLPDRDGICAQDTRAELQAQYNDLLALQDQTETVPLSKALDAVGLALKALEPMPPQPRNTEPLPCPFCGSVELTLTVDPHGWKIVQCDDCGTSGPCIDLEGEQYIERWNTRAVISAAQLQSGRVAVPRWWLEQIQEQLAGMGKLPSGPVGDWIFLFRDQVKDLLARSNVSSPAASAAAPHSGVSSAVLPFGFDANEALPAGSADACGSKSATPLHSPAASAAEPARDFNPEDIGADGPGDIDDGSYTDDQRLAQYQRLHSTAEAPAAEVSPSPKTTETKRKFLVCGDCGLDEHCGERCPNFQAVAVTSSSSSMLSWPADKLAAWARNWHWNDTAEDRPVDPSIYFRDSRMIRAFVMEAKAHSPADAPGFEPMKLQAKPPHGVNWTDIFPSQLEEMARLGYDVRAVEPEASFSSTKSDGAAQ